MERRATPPLLPILRSQQQGELLALLLGDPDLEMSLSALGDRIGIPTPSVHREIERAELAGLVTSRKVGNTRLVRAATDSPYFLGLADVLTKAFGPPTLLADALAPVPGVERAVVFGSWAARFTGDPGDRPVGDIDVLVLGDPDRDEVFARIRPVEERLGRPVQLTFRSTRWLDEGEGAFHDTVVGRPMVEVPLSVDGSRNGDKGG
ncbi:MAG: hypothetical protein KDB21_15395 [Acidimicrobiales bacterium]|nr:hypothetical protein [Acidimicrobiales bacterium]